jgi:photosystem II stability/assembly factor-like uncharacterized protein
MRRVGAFFVVVSLAAGAVPAAEAARWVRVSPFGGFMSGLAEAPSAPQTLYAVAWPGRVFASADGGESWSFRGEGRWELVDAELTVDAQDPQTVYALPQGSFLFRSRDGGRSWSLPPMDGLPWFEMVTVDPRSPGVLYAATRVGVYRSADGGDTWQLEGLSEQGVLTVAVDPLHPSSLVALTYLPDESEVSRAAVWRSADGGGTWVETAHIDRPGGLDAVFTRVVFDPARPGHAYLFFSGYPWYGRRESKWMPVMRSTDGGDSWTALPEATSEIVDLKAGADGTLIAAVGTGTSRSSDGGDTWSPVPRSTPWSEFLPRDTVTQVFASSTASHTFFATGRLGIWRSSDDGATWQEANQGLTALGATSLAVAPLGPVFLTTGLATYRSTDRGDTWTRVSSEYDAVQPFELVSVAPRFPPAFYGFYYDGIATSLVESTNAGYDWEILPLPYNCDGGGSICSVTLSGFAYDPRHPRTLVVGGAYYFHYEGPGRFLLRSDDRFDTWTELTPVHCLQDLVIDPERSETYFATACHGKLFRSDDAGGHWQRTGRGLPRDFFGEILVDPRGTPRRFYARTADHGVLVSTDGGATFHALVPRGDPLRVGKLLIDPSHPDRLFASAPEKGIFQWTAKTGRWTPVNEGLPQPLQNFRGLLALDPGPPATLYVATGQDVFRLDLDAD